MQRQTFISNSFFVDASVSVAKAALFTLPQKVTNVKFISESDRLHTLRFLLQLNEVKQYHVDISLLPLNDEYTQVNLHISHTDGHSFQADSHIRQALMSFKGFIVSILHGEKNIQPMECNTNSSVGWAGIVYALTTSLTGLFAGKRWG